MDIGNWDSHELLRHLDVKKLDEKLDKFDVVRAGGRVDDGRKGSSTSSGHITPRTQDMIDRKKTTAETSKWLATLLTSSTRHTCATNEPHELINVGYSYKDICFEYQPNVMDALVLISASSIEVKSYLVIQFSFRFPNRNIIIMIL